MTLEVGSGVEFQMWAVFAFILVGLVFYVFERAAMEVTSHGIICALLIFFHFFPVIHDGVPALTPGRMLQGFANPALITVLALLVMGQGMVRTGVLDRGANLLLGVGGGSLTVSLLLILVAAMAVSAFLNNIPVVVIFIPIMQDRKSVV